jgi:hypothetical protein
MGLETNGRIHKLFETKQVTERFRKREFVVELADNPRYPQFVMFQLTGDRCENLDGYNEGDEVRVEFSLRGREWKSPQGEIRFFNSLDVWTLERAGASSGDRAGLPDDVPPPTDQDDIPF